MRDVESFKQVDASSPAVGSSVEGIDAVNRGAHFASRYRYSWVVGLVADATRWHDFWDDYEEKTVLNPSQEF